MKKLVIIAIILLSMIQATIANSYPGYVNSFGNIETKDSELQKYVSIESEDLSFEVSKDPIKKNTNNDDIVEYISYWYWIPKEDIIKELNARQFKSYLFSNNNDYTSAMPVDGVDEDEYHSYNWILFGPLKINVVEWKIHVKATYSLYNNSNMDLNKQKITFSPFSDSILVNPRNSYTSKEFSSWYFYITNEFAPSSFKVEVNSWTVSSTKKIVTKNINQSNHEIFCGLSWNFCFDDWLDLNVIKPVYEFETSIWAKQRQTITVSYDLPIIDYSHVWQIWALFDIQYDFGPILEWSGNKLSKLQITVKIPDDLFLYTIGFAEKLALYWQSWLALDKHVHYSTANWINSYVLRLNNIIKSKTLNQLYMTFFTRDWFNIAIEEWNSYRESFPEMGRRSGELGSLWISLPTVNKIVQSLDKYLVKWNDGTVKILSIPQIIKLNPQQAGWLIDK